MINIIHNPESRLWKAKLKNGRYINLDINNKKQLNYYLENMDYESFYFSKSCYNIRKPKNIEKMKDKKDRIWHLDFLIDIDKKPIIELQKLLYIMKSYGFKPIYILNTSPDSYQVNYCGIKLTKEQMENIRNNVEIDYEITKDPFRVIRLPLSENRKYTPIFKTKLLDFNAVLNKGHEEQLESLLDRGEMKPKFVLQDKMKEYPQASQGIPFHYYSYIENRVNKNNYVVILRYKNKDIAYKDSRKIQGMYKLGTLYCFKYDDEIAFISLKCFNKNRIRKIMNASKSINKNENGKFKKNYIRISSRINENLNNKDYPKKFAAMNSINSGYYSKRHLDFVKFLGFNPDLDGFSHGIEEEEIKIYHGKFRGELNDK